MKKEILIFLTILILLAVVQHPDLLTEPMKRFTELPSATVYGMGALHPLVITFLVYGVFWVARWIFTRVKKAFFKA